MAIYTVTQDSVMAAFLLYNQFFLVSNKFSTSENADEEMYCYQKLKIAFYNSICLWCRRSHSFLYSFVYITFS